MASIPRKTDASLPSSAEPSSAARRWKYDVYLSFRGEDTREALTSQLNDGLQRRGVKTFMDGQDLAAGDAIGQDLFGALEGSRFAIVVLSRTYAVSSWCLEELTKICQFMEDGSRILPVFYDVEPSDVRNQRGSFQKAFTRHEVSGLFEPEKVRQWRDALRRIADISGWETKNYDTETGVVEAIVESVYSKLQSVVVSQSPDLTKIQGTLAGLSGYSTGKPKLTVTNWKKGDLLGSGSFGSVYEGITEGGCLFAVKEVSLLDQQSVSLFEQEIALLSQFEHENIVQYYGTQKDESKLYMFLELLTNGSLQKLYQTYPLTDSLVSVYTRQILQGLKYLHDQNVIHRDIKCANILVHANGSVKLVGFGLAKAIKRNDIIDCQGTANWMAPEVVKPESPGYGLPADIWSLGCTVLEMLTRMVPYPGLELMAVLWKIMKGEPPLVPDSLSSEAQYFIHLCLQVEPDNRPTAAQLLKHPFVNKPLPPTSSGSVSPYNHHRHCYAPIPRKTAASLPSSVESSSSACPWISDVFLSFRGEDTRRGFTSHLYSRLLERGITTFMYNQVGDDVFPTLLEAVEGSRFAIVVLSQNYAYSAWCLDELTKICEFMESGYRILPVFYDVDPSDVRNQKGSFQFAFTKHERSGRYEPEKVQLWRDALRRTANLVGWETRNYSTESKCVEDIVEFVYSKLQPVVEINTGGFEATRQAPIEIEPTISRKTAASLPSSAEPLSTAGQWKYDVYLSFRGVATRRGFTSHLYDRLQKRGITTFMDDQDLQVGNDVSPTLLKAMEGSRFAIVVLSQNYASSARCLDELTKICQLMRDSPRILPVFYEVESSDVKKQEGSFQDAFTKHEYSGRHKSEKVQQRRDALRRITDISGWDTKNYSTESKCVEDIVEYVWRKMQFVLEVEKVQPIEINTGSFEVFEATRKAIDEVMEALKEDEVTAIGVYGMGGVGKTTLVKHVAAQSCKNGTFHHVIMAVVSQCPNFQRIQHTLAELLGIKLEESEFGRAATLHEDMLRRENLLIILDDVWESIELSKIGIPSYMELQKCKSKVLLTTRMMNICHVMRCQRKINLSILSKDDSWTLFMRNAGRSFESTTFEGVAKKVTGECAGLPIALRAVARALGDKNLQEWEKAAQQLQKSQSANSLHEDDAFRCIKLSYDYLKDEDSKSCFLLCCLFPKGYDIPIGDLFKYAIGKGLFRDADTIEEARGTADSVVMYLKDSRLLLDSEKNGCVRMHDVIWDTAIMIANSEDGLGFLVKAGCGLKSWPRQRHEGYCAISLMKNDIHKLPGELVCPKLQILLLQQNADLNEIPETFFQSPSELRVLDLSLTSITALPQSFSLLMNLQALYLDFCQRLIDFSVLGKLKKLEILSMRGNVLKELSGEIGNLINLRMLDITDGIISKIPSKVISQLHRLEELYMPFRFGNWVSKVEGEGEETDIGFGEVTGLSCLNILKVSLSAKCIPEELEFYPNWLFFDICISGDTSSRDITRDISNQGSQHSHKDSRSLSLDTRISALPAWFVHEVTVKTEKLLYVKCKWLNNILVEYHHGRLHMLKHLSIIGPSESLEELMNAISWVPVKPVFENLEELHLECVTSLKELCVGKLPPGSLYNLKLLKVHYCPNLGKILLPSKLLQRLPNLENIICKDMSRLEHVFGCQGFEPEQSKLREMTFINLPAIRNICNGPAPRAMFQALKSLFIYHCNFLGCLFSFDTAQVLFQLEDLFVDSCPLLKRLIEVCTERVNNRNIILPKLKNLGLEKLPILFSGGATIDIECPSLEHLYVKECPQFTASASDFQSKNQVQVSDKLHYFGLLGRRTESQHIEALAESVFSTVRPIETEFTMPMGDFQAFEVTRQAMDEVMKALGNDEVTAIGVYGMRGVGKTTMVEHVSAEVRDNGMFNHVISAVVSQNPDLRKIQGTLADMLGFILEEETEIGRACRLMQRIRRGNRILIILDNIWERTHLSHIGIPSYHELRRCNSKVLLITRTQNVCDAMGCQLNISLDVISDKDSWALFVNKARMSVESTTFCNVAKKVARACAGLPVALIAVAKALGDKCLDDWKEASRRLEASQPANLEYEKAVFNCIKLSYDYLISDDARSCFLLCCLFPEDSDIQIEDLLKYGMGKGLFQDSSTMHDARASAYSVVKYLKDCGLLLKSEQGGCVKMHDVIQDVAILIAEDDPLFLAKAGCQLKEWPSISAHEGYSAISLIGNKICKLPEELVCPKLLILLLQSNVCLNKIPDCFFQSLNVLRVLDLSRTRISLLPTSFKILINLQTLYLDGCLSTIDNISILGKLKKLEILTMRGLPLVELPKEIGDLSHLRMLDITGDYVDNVPSEVIRNLNLLEELYMQCNFADWGSKVEGAGEENIVAFDELTGLSYLNVLKVFISDAKCLPKDVEVEPNWVNFDICISRDPSIRKVSLVSSSSPAFTRALTLDTTINALPGWFINAVTMKAEKLKYIMCWGLDNILVEYDCGRLHELKYLSVIGPNENLKVLMNTVTRFRNEPVLQNLEELHLIQVHCLKELCVGDLPPGSLCNLRLLKVKHCYELVDALLPSGLLQRLQNLDKVICEEIDELEYVFGCEGLKPEQMILTQLKEMRLENLGRLIKIWNGPAPCAIFQNLQSLVVSGCYKLKNLFSAEVAQYLLHLKDISVELCPILDNVIEASKETVDNEIVFPKLKNLALIKLPQLTRFCGSTGCVIKCPLLEYLYVDRCPQFPTFDFHSRNEVQRNHPQHLDIVQRRESREDEWNCLLAYSNEEETIERWNSPSQLGSGW